MASSNQGSFRFNMPVFDRVSSTTPGLTANGLAQPMSSHTLRSMRNQMLLAAQDGNVDELRRTRTKFTIEQICELETLFATSGPHPSDELRASAAKRLNLDEKTIRIWMQNRRQREAKNSVASSDAQLAKDSAKADSKKGGFSSEADDIFGSTPFPPKSSSVCDLTTNHVDESARSRSRSISSRNSSRARKLSTQAARLGRTISLDHVAGLLEKARDVPTINKRKSEGDCTSSDAGHSNETTPIKSRMNVDNNSNGSPPLWAHMISSPPSPPPLRQRVEWERLKTLTERPVLELACAKDRIRRQTSEDEAGKPISTLVPKRSRPNCLCEEKPRKKVQTENVSRLSNTKAVIQLKENNIVRASSLNGSSMTATSSEDEEVKTPQGSSSPAPPRGLSASSNRFNQVQRMPIQVQKMPTHVQKLVTQVVKKPAHVLNPKEDDAVQLLATFFGTKV